MLTIRRAELRDLESITAIYNDAIAKTIATFDTQPKTTQEQISWFEKHGPKHPILVADSGDEVIGWISLSEWSDRCAYSDTAEASLYVGEEHRRKGVGRKLLESALDEGREIGLHTIVSRIAGGNETSVRLHESLGFQHIGIMREVGRKFGKLIDVYLMQKIF
jgi:phosphinothricin acetyltransferase